jgi:hypothetical protein
MCASESLNGRKEKDIYFIILYKRKQKEENDELILPKTYITNIYTEIEGENGSYIYKVFKLIQDKNFINPINVEFDIGRDSYEVSFKAKEYSFIYDVELKKRRKILKNIEAEIIDQNIKDYFSKLNIFIQALKKNNEEDKIDKLYRETIEIYSDKKSFAFMVKLFVHIYANKELCSLLMEKFKEINIKERDNEKYMNENEDLKQYDKDFNKICSEINYLIKNNSYDPIQFYGIILC